MGQALVLGLAMSVASTVVLMRVLMDAASCSTPHGHVAVGWLIVEDLFTVVVLVLLPVLAADGGAARRSRRRRDVWSRWPSASSALVRGRRWSSAARVVPWLLGTVARARVARAVHAHRAGRRARHRRRLGRAVRRVDGAGGVPRGHGRRPVDVSHQAAADALPLRDAFAVLFFVSVGMLFDPAFLLASALPWSWRRWPSSWSASRWPRSAIVALLGHPPRTALTVAAGLAQIGEFSFILATSAYALGSLPR